MEWCPTCVAQHRATRSDEDLTKHRATGCRFNKCNEHCDCTKEEKIAQRAAIAQLNLRGRRCADCSTATQHACYLVRNDGNETRTYPHYVICAGHCTICTTTYATTPCSQRPERGVTIACHSCGAHRIASECISREHQVWYYTDENGDDLVEPYRATERIYTCLRCNTNILHCRRCHVVVDPANANEDTWCQECNACARNGYQRCCICARHRPRLFPIDTVRFDNATGNKTKHNPVERAIGVEIEVAGFQNPTKQALENLYNTCVQWRAAIGTDGSIGSNGVEIRTSPATGMAFLKQIRDVTKALREANVVVDERCGLHVHVDMRDEVLLTVAQTQQNKYASLATLWYLLEPQFFAMVEARRKETSYCKGTIHTISSTYGYSFPNDMLLQAMQRARLSQLVRRSDRYHALNWQSLSRHKTVEYRLHHGTINRRIITAWALLVAKLTDYAMKLNEPTLEQVIRWITKRGAVPFLERIAPTPDAKRYVTWRQNLTRREAA